MESTTLSENACSNNRYGNYAVKLAVKESLPEIPEKFLEIANKQLLKTGKISIPFLMRKLSCSERMAYQIMDALHNDNYQTLGNKENTFISKCLKHNIYLDESFECFVCKQERK